MAVMQNPFQFAAVINIFILWSFLRQYKIAGVLLQSVFLMGYSSVSRFGAYGDYIFISKQF